MQSVMCTVFWRENLSENSHLEDQEGSSRSTFKRILGEYVVMLGGAAGW